MKRRVGLGVVVGALLVPSGVGAQTVRPHLYLSPPTVAAAPWTLPHEERRATIVSALPAPRRYRVCNDSNTPVVVTTDAPAPGFPLPGRTCADVAAKAITISQPAVGIPAYGTYLELQ
ncbi:MAG: hypothetical protein HY728_00130 [Candidatus Rokubacteria bacterium]|nr:hypothetical protein [Candidatus Rokubacteria bacterium]